MTVEGFLVFFPFNFLCFGLYLVKFFGSFLFLPFSIIFFFLTTIESFLSFLPLVCFSIVAICLTFFFGVGFVFLPISTFFVFFDKGVGGDAGPFAFPTVGCFFVFLIVNAILIFYCRVGFLGSGLSWLNRAVFFISFLFCLALSSASI